MTVEAFLERLKGVRRNGSGWQALCPAHADKNPSLSIQLIGSNILFHCHAGCSQQAVLGSLGIQARELHLASGDGERRIVAIYDYPDEQGKLLYQVMRFEPKDFRQRRPDGNGGWIPSLSGTRRVLYRLPAVLKATSVLVVEGERDCETARKMGLVATCNPGGAGKWRNEYSQSLIGKRVVIIADGDAPGQKHGQEVANSLSGKVKSLKVLELPAAKDLTEFSERGGTRETLLGLIKNAAEWKPETTNKGGFRLTTLGELLKEPEEAVSWLLADKLPAGGISVLAAKPKVGKSTLARCLALAVATGKAFLGCETAQGPVIYLALEEKRSEVRQHFSDLGATGNEPIHIHCASAPQDAMAALCQLTKELKPVLVVIDPLFKFVRIRDEKAYAEVCQAIEPLLSLARETGTHVMLVHHCGKAEKADAMDAILGSTAIFGGVDSGLVLRRSDRYRTLKSEQKYGIDWPETVLEFDSGTRALSLGAEKSEADSQVIANGILDYLQSAGGVKTEPEIDEAVEGKTGPKRKALRVLVEQGTVGRDGSGKRGDPFKYSSLFSCCEDIAGTREQETEIRSQSPVNTEIKLVPDLSMELNKIHDPREQEFLEGVL